MAPVLPVIVLLFQVTKAAYEVLRSMPQAYRKVNASFTVYDWSHTEFVSSSDCSWGSWTSCFILTAQEGSEDDAESGTCIDTLFINTADYIDIRTTFSWQFNFTVSGIYFQLIVYNATDGDRGISIFDKLLEADITNTSTVATVTSHFHLGGQADRATQLQLRFRTWCDSEDCIDGQSDQSVQTVYLNDIFVTGNATNSTISPTSMPTKTTMFPTTSMPISQNASIYPSTVLWNGTAAPKINWNEWSRSNSISVGNVSASNCYTASDPCLKLCANSTKVEWEASLLKTPIINVSNFIDILLEFNVQTGEITSGSMFTVDLETDEPSSNMIADYNKTDLVCHSIQLVRCYFVTCFQLEF